MNILVVGGAGYIGSHCVYLLKKQGFQVSVLDNLCLGHREAIPHGVTLHECDLGDRPKVEKILKDDGIDLVMHFAAFALVGESVTQPKKYYDNNMIATLALIDAMVATGVKHFVFSSTCATFGIPDVLPMTEDTPQYPINPYGETKLAVERALHWYAGAYDLNFASFRYFNAAGASPEFPIGEDHQPETHLIPLIIDTILGKRDVITVFGTDYPTEDGTCLRDYVHVDDLSHAHIAAIPLLTDKGGAHFFNLGTGRPYSVKEVISAVEQVTGKKVPVQFGDRRAGDPPALYANSTKAKAELNWVPQYNTIESIVETAWKWHQANPNGY